jgi:hypothetical protein
MTIEALDFAEGEGWGAYNGDCIDVLRQLPEASVGYSVFSPPFASSLYLFEQRSRSRQLPRPTRNSSRAFAFVLDELMRGSKTWAIAVDALHGHADDRRRATA